jgi:hypothetical protein
MSAHGQPFLSFKIYQRCVLLPCESSALALRRRILSLSTGAERAEQRTKALEPADDVCRGNATGAKLLNIFQAKLYTIAYLISDRYKFK